MSLGSSSSYSESAHEASITSSHDGSHAAETNECSDEQNIGRDPAGISATRQLLLPPLARNSSTKRPNLKSNSRRRLFFLRDWWLESFACFIYVIALIATVATLYPHQNRSLPQWPYKISVNSLIAIYIVVFKATIVFVAAEGLGQLKWRWFASRRPLVDIATYDSASRGPLGAARLLWTLGFRHPLSSCGALITISMLAIDPFAQLIIQYYDCTLPIHNFIATIPRTNLYCMDYSDSFSALGSAVDTGMFSPGGLVSASCQTGNCSFPHPYATVGYCSGCFNVTEELKLNRSSLYSNRTGPFVYLPSGTSMNSSEVITATLQSADDEPGTTVAELISQTTDHAFSMDTCQNGINLRNCAGYSALRCKIGACVRSYTATILTGNLQESLIDDGQYNGLEKSSVVWGRGPWPTNQSLATIDTNCVSDVERNTLLEAGYRIDPTTRWLPYNVTEPIQTLSVANNSIGASLLQRGCMYGIDSDTIATLMEYLVDILGGVVNDYPTPPLAAYRGPQSLQIIYNSGSVTLDSVTKTFANISESLTNYIRQNGQANNSDPAIGIVMHDQTCLRVQWGWLAFPTVMTLMTLIFFIATVVVTKPTADKAPVWKSSPLPLLFHGLEERSHLQESVPLVEIKDMEQRAKMISVRLTASNE